MGNAQDDARGGDSSAGEMADRSWYPIYAAVIVCTVFVILALYAFSRYFSG